MASMRAWWEEIGRVRVSPAGALLLTVVVLLLCGVYLMQAHRTTVYEHEVIELEEQIETLRWENRRLLEEVMWLESRDRLETRAREMGFVPAGGVEPIYVWVEVVEVGEGVSEWESFWAHIGGDGP